MGAISDYRWIQQIVDKYKAKLKKIDDAQWQVTPPIHGWSYSEVYYHIFDASILSLIQLTESAEGRGKSKPTAFAVKLILFLGMLPPGKRFTAPKTLAERVKKVEKDDMLVLMEVFLKQLQTAYPKLKKADLSIKAPHPKMGYLNPNHWLRFIAIHLNHHLKQLQRIEKSY
ncbi:MAG: DinB family protein [Pedobacter sp.]|uniref:DinB family protein n=1 Tax=Pedobacter sp. JCM 36344 TaxID=3374280 RepID=UPI00199B11C6|nr:DinB family protein [Pedobacter sp.]